MKKEMGKMVIIAALALALIAPCLPAVAQDKPADQPADNMQIFREKVKADKKLIVAEAMELKESEAKAFWPVYEAYQKEIAGLNDRTIALIKDYAQNYQTMTNQKAKKLTDESMAIQAAQPKLKASYLPKFRKALPDIKVARYYQIESKISAVVNYELAAAIPLVK